MNLIMKGMVAASLTLCMEPPLFARRLLGRRVTQRLLL